MCKPKQITAEKKITNKYNGMHTCWIRQILPFTHTHHTFSHSKTLQRKLKISKICNVYRFVVASHISRCSTLNNFWIDKMIVCACVFFCLHLSCDKSQCDIAAYKKKSYDMIGSHCRCAASHVNMSVYRCIDKAKCEKA